ncbi:CHAD domain-containing protein [Sulfurovum sp.]|uniref:CYTH and CHAD domain-containing protein n=1 Tax=Sulfurovum sp. TaxID=1969726 RepID=UPI002867C365|nr:CHAD domain-containing protein [Sulfurovum sp.]
MKEIEKKYLLKDSIISLIDAYSLKPHKITQFYTTITPTNSVRYRQMDDQYFKTIKHGTGASRDEEEMEISEQKFQKKFEDRIKNPIRKNRYMFLFEEKEYSIDVFKKDFKGLFILEIEFPSMEDFEQFKLPAILKTHIIKDVTFDESFKNKNMVLYGRPQTTYDLNTIFTELDKEDIDELDAYFIPNLSPLDALRVILYKYSLSILFYKERIILHGDTEDLHQFRVSIRKSRAFLKEFDFLFPKKQYTYLYDTLAKVAKFTNQKRDLDVIKNRLQHLGEKHDTVKQDISKHQEDEHQKIIKMLKSETFEHFFKDYQSALKNETLVNTHNTAGTIEHTAKKVIEMLHHKIILKIDSLEKRFDTEKLHKIRIALKKFRYLLEEFQHIFDEEKIDTMIQKGKTLQTLLGNFNDSVNQNRLLHNYFKANKKNIPDRKKLEHTLLDKTTKSQKKSMAHAIKELNKFKRKALRL